MPGDVDAVHRGLASDSERRRRQEAGVTVATAGAFTYPPLLSLSLSWSSSHLPRGRAPLPPLSAAAQVISGQSSSRTSPPWLLPLLFGPGAEASTPLRSPQCHALCATILVAAFGFIDGWKCTLGAATRAGSRAWFSSREPRAGVVVSVRGKGLPRVQLVILVCCVCAEPCASCACLLVQRKSRADISR